MSEHPIILYKIGSQNVILTYLFEYLRASMDLALHDLFLTFNTTSLSLASQIIIGLTYC